VGTEVNAVEPRRLIFRICIEFYFHVETAGISEYFVELWYLETNRAYVRDKDDHRMKYGG
jgi:hypothetical protein